MRGCLSAAGTLCPPSALRRAYGQLCGAVGIGLNLLLFAVKFFAGSVSGSIAITADAFNNLSDAGSSLVTLLGFRLAGRKPDPEHPFSHGRMEYISGLVVSGLILLMGVELGKSSMGKILHPEEVASSPLVLVILVVSIGVKLYMFSYNRAVGKKIHSTAMDATAMDSLSDAVSTAAVLVATLVGQFTGLMIDGWVGLLVALFILYSAYKAAKETLSPLLGQTPDPEFVRHIQEIVLSYPEVQNVHDLIVHDYGPGRVIISLHAEVSASGNLLQLHDVIDNIEHRLQKELGCVAVIHMDPIVTDDPETQRLRLAVAEKVKTIDPPAHHTRLPHGSGPQPHEPDLRHGGALRGEAGSGPGAKSASLSWCGSWGSSISPWCRSTTAMYCEKTPPGHLTEGILQKLK